MSESDQTQDDVPAPRPADPREQMKAALEAKKAHTRKGTDHADAKGKGSAVRAPQAGKRQFRRKSGG